jgi:hypothetical protein
MHALPPIAPAPADAEAVLSQAATAAPQPQPTPPPRRVIPFPLPDLLAALVSYSQPALQHLAGELKKAADAASAAGTDPKEATRNLSHFEAIRAWCAAHPEAAARIVICGAYLAEGSGKFIVQQETAAEEAPADAPPAGEGGAG